MPPTGQREWLEAFIELYRCEPCLWKTKSTEYYDRSKKDAAYEKLINKLRELEPTATRESVIKKINNLRCTYKKEYKKVIASLANSSDTVYEPKLWYYSLLTFLDSQETSRLSGSESDRTNEMNTLKLSHVTSGSGTDTDLNTMSEVDWNLKCLAIKSRNSSEPILAGNISDDSSTRWSPKTNPGSAADSKDVLFTVQQFHPPVQEDRSDIVGKLVTLKLRDLNKEQGLLAEKIINEALFEAELGRLTAAHTVMAPEQDSQLPTCCALCETLTLDLPVPVLQYGNTPNGNNTFSG